MHEEYQRLLDDCNDELTKIKAWIVEHPLDSNVVFLTRYAIIKTSGTIEYILKQMLYDYLSEGVIDDTKNYLSKYVLQNSGNPNFNFIKKSIEHFNGTMASDFENKLKQYKGALNRLVEARNKFAHVGTIDIQGMFQIVEDGFHAGSAVLEGVFELLFHMETDE